MSKIWLWVLMMLWPTIGQGQQRYYDTDFTVSEKSFAFTVPIEFERDQIFLTLEFQGRPYRFKLDTGASQGVIYDDIALEGQREMGFIKSEDATGQSRQVTTVELPTFRIGDLEVKGYKVQRMSRRVARKGEDGIVGFALFHKGIAAKIDTRSLQLTLTDKKNYFKQEKGEILKYRLHRHVPYIRISPFEGLEEEVLFDTGSALPYAINCQSFDQIVHRYPAISDQVEGSTYGSRTIGHFGTERSGPITFLELKRLMWGNFTFNDVHCTTIRGGSHVGAKLLEYGSLIINPFRRQLILQPYDSLSSCTIANRLPEIVIVENNGKAMIGMVRDKSRAWADGFRQGQIIERVDGKPLTFEQFFNFRWVNGERYIFTFHPSSNTKATIRAFWPLQYNRWE